MAALCPTGGSYWNPKCCWWCTSSPLCTVLTRIYDIVRIASWVLGRIVDFFVTLLFGVIIPIVRLVFYGLLSYWNFLIGLLLGEFRFGAITIFFPIFFIILSWLLWFFWPQLGCLIEDVVWPLINFFLNSIGFAVQIIISVLNALVRIWNNFVPLVGFVIYLAVTLLVTTFAAVVQLLGEFDVYALVGSLLEIVMLLTELAIEILLAIVLVPTGELSEAVDAIGPLITITFASIDICVQALAWVLGALWLTLEPILDVLVRVVRVVKKHFFARALLDLVTEPSLRDMGTSDDIGDELWHSLGVSASRYWDDESGNRALKDLRSMNKKRETPQHAIDYYYLRRSSMMSGPMASGPRHLMEADLPAGWSVGDETTARSHVEENVDSYTGIHHPHLRDILNDIDVRIRTAKSKTQSHPMPIEEEMEMYHVKCRSKLCGGHDTALPHPFKTIAKRAGTLPPLEEDTPHKRRARFTQTAALAHVARHTIRHGLHKFWYKGDGSLPKHAGNAWKSLTGHRTIHATLEYLTTQRDDPFESVHTFVPVLSEWRPFSWMLDSAPEEYRSQFMGHHTRRQVAKWRRRHLTASDQEETQPLHWMGDVMAHHERRGKFEPEGDPRTGEILANAEEVQEQPAVSSLQLLYATDCFVSRPKNALCIPEIAPQLGCLLAQILAMFPDKPPVQFCDYEEECADLGFCIIERPPVTPDLIAIFSNVDLWLSWCWIQNGIVWIGVVLGISFPIIKLTFQVLSALLPFLSFIFDGFIAIIPTTVTLQDLVCLIPFAYGIVLIITLIQIFNFTVLPLLRFALRSFVTLEAMFAAIRSIEASTLAYKENAGYAQIYKQFYDTKPENVLPFDPWTGQPNIGEPKRREDPEDPADVLRAQSGRLRVFPAADGFMPYIPLTSGYEPAANVDIPPFQHADLRVRNASTYAQTPLLAEVGADQQMERGPRHPDELDANQRRAVAMYRRALERGLTYFGEPARVITSQDVHDYEARWRPFLHSAHWTSGYITRYINEYHYQREKVAERKPPVFLGQRGWFAHLFE